MLGCLLVRVPCAFKKFTWWSWLTERFPIRFTMRTINQGWRGWQGSGWWRLEFCNGCQRDGMVVGGFVFSIPLPGLISAQLSFLHAHLPLGTLKSPRPAPPKFNCEIKILSLRCPLHTLDSPSTEEKYTNHNMITILQTAPEVNGLSCKCRGNWSDHT